MYFVKEVKDKRAEREFIELPVRLYAGNPYWVRPLDNDIRHVFDPEKNPCFKAGECTRWLLEDEGGKCVGRVAAFVNRKTCGLDKYKVGQMGFFECIDDREAAFMLFDRCRAWLEERGYEILKRNFHSRFGEIDIIARRGPYIAFVEVKTRAQNSLVSPLEAITPAKQRKLTATALEYLRQNPSKLQPRFDAAAVCLREGCFAVEQYLENAFFAH